MWNRGEEYWGRQMNRGNMRKRKSRSRKKRERSSFLKQSIHHIAYGAVRRNRFNSTRGVTVIHPHSHTQRCPTHKHGEEQDCPHTQTDTHPQRPQWEWKEALPKTETRTHTSACPPCAGHGWIVSVCVRVSGRPLECVCMALKVSEHAGLTVCRFPTGIVVREHPTGVVVFNNLSGTQATHINTKQHKQATLTTEFEGNSVDQI